MRSKNVTIWGRQFDLKISYDHFDNDVIPVDMREARDSIFDSWQSVEDALPSLKQYCLEHNADDVEHLYGGKIIDNIFRIVVPDCLYVLPSEKEHTVALMLNYRFDLEEGLALLFIDEKLDSICPQSEVF